MESLTTIECTTTLKHVHYLPNERAEDTMVTMRALPQSLACYVLGLSQGNVLNPLSYFQFYRKILQHILFIGARCAPLTQVTVNGLRSKPIQSSTHARLFLTAVLNFFLGNPAAEQRCIAIFFKFYFFSFLSFFLHLLFFYIQFLHFNRTH